MLKIENLIKTYGKFTAVDGLNLEVGKGVVFGFVGPNGAGKTTTMKIIAGLLKPTSGKIYINGSTVSENIKSLRGKIGYMPDFFGVYDDLKVSEYMDFYEGAYYVPVDKRSSLTDGLLELVNLSDKKNAYVDGLSRGMKQRLCLARSLVCDPDLLILDEPASGLDPVARSEMKDILKKLGELQKTIIISSHILPELAEMCSEVGIMNKGKLRVKGCIADIMRLMSKKRSFVIKVEGGYEGARKFLEEQPKAEDIRQTALGMEFVFNAETDGEISALLRSAIAGGLPVTEFREKEGNLEEIFMEAIADEK